MTRTMTVPGGGGGGSRRLRRRRRGGCVCEKGMFGFRSAPETCQRPGGRCRAMHIRPCGPRAFQDHIRAHGAPDRTGYKACRTADSP